MVLEQVSSELPSPPLWVQYCVEEYIVIGENLTGREEKKRGEEN